MFRSIVLLAFGILLLSAPTRAEPLLLDARPIALNPEDKKQERLGRLVWRGSLEITSPDSRFGGLSGLLLTPGDPRLLAITDTGFWVRVALEHDTDGKLSDLGAAEIWRMKDPEGRALAGKDLADSESLARLEDGSILVAFEQEHRIWRYPSGGDQLGSAAEAFPRPPNLNRFADNGGLEGLTVLRDGRILALVEHDTDEPAIPGFLWQNGKWSELAITRDGPYRPTGATTLPSGDVLVLERRFSFIGGLGIKIRRLPLAELRPGATLAGEVLAEMGPPLAYDNMEGIAAVPEEGGTRIYIVADDNFNFAQRTVLMSFWLAEQ